jgi:RNA polymerase sigma-70 factor (ECF subfamily)
MDAMSSAQNVSHSNFGRQLEHEIPRLRRYARTLTARRVGEADDLVQDCLVRALSKQHLWRQGTDLRAWLFTILHNQHVNHIRRVAREGNSIPIEDLSVSVAVRPDAMASLELRDLDRGIAELPIQQRQVVKLVGIEGKRYEEVADRLGVPVGTVRSRLSRARDALRRRTDFHEADADAAMTARTTLH